MIQVVLGTAKSKGAVFTERLKTFRLRGSCRFESSCDGVLWGARSVERDTGALYRRHPLWRRLEGTR
jgi:hypothetical protein